MATSAEDKKVLALMNKVLAEKESIDKLTKPQWKTSGSLSLYPMMHNEGERLTIAVETGRQQLAIARWYLNNLREAFEDAQAVNEGLVISTKWQGYEIDEWISDIDQRLAILDIKERQAKLATLETKLNALTSPEQRRRMELAAIEKELG